MTLVQRALHKVTLHTFQFQGLTLLHASESQHFEEMCPLRLILIFLSATLAGFFVIRNLRSQPQPTQLDDDASSPQSLDASIPATSKVRLAIESGFWTFVDMASGRYLWNYLTSSSSSKRST